MYQHLKPSKQREAFEMQSRHSYKTLFALFFPSSFSCAEALIENSSPWKCEAWIFDVNIWKNKTKQKKQNAYNQSTKIKTKQNNAKANKN